MNASSPTSRSKGAECKGNEATIRRSLGEIGGTIRKYATAREHRKSGMRIRMLTVTIYETNLADIIDYFADYD